MLVQELLGDSESRGVWYNLGEGLAPPHLGVYLLGRHDGRALVAGDLLVPHHAHKELVAVCQSVAEQRLVSHVAQIVDIITVHISEHRHKGHVEVEAEITEDCDVVDNDHSQYGGVVKDGNGGH